MIINFFEAASRFCDRVARFVLIVAGALMAVIIILQVFFRFFVKIPLPWSEELARYLMIWIGMMGSSLALSEGRHIGVTFVMERIRGRIRQVLMIGAILAVFWFLGLVVREGGQIAWINYAQLSPAMMIPMLAPYAAIPVGGVFMLVQVFRKLLLVLRDHRNPVSL